MIILSTQTLATILLLSVSAGAQSGGGYTITQAVIAGGGGAAAGAGYENDATTGEPVSGVHSSGGQFGIAGGFWGPAAPQAPTAAGVLVSGRVSTPDGRGLRNAMVKISDSRGITVDSLSSAFGYFSFENIPSGQTYVITISSKLYHFGAQTLVVNDSVTDLNLVGLE